MADVHRRVHRRQAALLANLDTHWFERLVLPLLAVGFSLSTTALAGDLLTFLIEAVRPSPWIAAGCAIAAVGGVYGAQFRERVNAPQFLRAAEILGHLALTYAMLRIGGFAAEYPAVSVAAVRLPEVYVPLGLVYLSWRLARTAGVRFVWIGSVVQNLGEQVAAKLAWDQESVVSTSGLGDRRASVTRFFAWRALGYALIGCILAAGAFDSYRDVAAAQPIWRFKVAAALACLLFFGLLLQGAVHLYRLRSLWDVTGVDVTPGVYQRWVSQSAIAVLAALLVGIAVPAFSFFDFQATVAWISNGLSDFFAHGLEVFNRQVLGRQTPRMESFASKPPMGGGVGAAAAAAQLIFLLAAFMSASLMIGALLLIFFRSEWRKLPGLLRLPVLSVLWLRSIGLYLAKAAVTLFSWSRRLARLSPIGGSDAAGGAVRPTLSSELAANRKAPAGSVRRYFVRLVDEAARRGFPLEPHQTAREYSHGLARKLGGVDQELRFLTDRYEEVRYGDREEGPGDEEPVRRAYERVVTSLAETLGQAARKGEGAP